MKRSAWLAFVSLICALGVACADGVDPCTGSSCSNANTDAGEDPATGGFTVHYYSPWPATYVHFDDGGGWTATPGKMMTAETEGWFAYNHDAANKGGLELVFNDGAANWDNNGDKNYTTELNEFWIKGGKVYDKKPSVEPPSDWCKDVMCGKGACNGAEQRCDCDEGYLYVAKDKTCAPDPCAGVECGFGELCDPKTQACSQACTPDKKVGDFLFCAQTTTSSVAAIVEYSGAGELDLSKSEVRLNDEAIAASEIDVDTATKRMAVKASGLEASKYSYLFRMKTVTGTDVRPLFIPLWVGEGIRYADFGWKDANMYQIMTDRFLDGDAKNNLSPTLGTLAEVTDLNSQWQGGDFRGIIDKIKDGYFTSMGINALWISSPLLNSHKSQPAVDLTGPKSTQRFASYHSYHPIVTGYTHLDHLEYDNPIETAFGTPEELHELIREAHLRGIRVVPDFVANHVQKEAKLYTLHSDWFSPYNPCDGNWDARRIDCWFTTDMPDFDFGANPEAITKVVDHAIWMIEEYNFDGFRADALKHMDDKFVRALKSAVVEQIETTVKNHDLTDEATTFYMVGESLGGWARYHVRKDMVQGQVDEQFYYKVRDCILGPQTLTGLAGFAVANDTAYLTAQPTQGESGGYPGAVMGNFFGNHDQPRALTQANGSYARLKLAQTFLMTSPGNIPMLYQGDDIGTLGGADPDNRKMHRFDGLTPAEQAALDNAKKLGILREKHVALRRGKRSTVQVEDLFWVYKVSQDNDTVYVVLNRDQEKSYTPPDGYVDGLGNCSGGKVPAEASCVFVAE